MSTDTIERRRLAERMNASEDDYEPGGVATPPAETAATEVFKFSPGQERWPPGTPGGLGGQWKDDGVPNVDVSVGKKVVPAIIYKKHKDGAVVAQRGSRRLRWDAGAKKYAAEEREGGTWVEKQKLTKTAAYAELKDGDWREESGGTDLPVPAPKSESTPTAGNRVEKLKAEEHDAAEAELVDWNSPLREEYARAALNESTLGTTTYVARDANGRLIGALAVRDFSRETAAEVDVDHPYAYVEFAGAREGSGAGTDLTRRAIEHALTTDASALYLQATEESSAYWERQGFIDDPLDAGVELYGMNRKQMQKWLDERGSGPATTEDAPPVPDSGTGVPPMSSETPEAGVPVVQPATETSSGRFDSLTSAHINLTPAQREIDSRIRHAFTALQGRTDLPESHKEIVPGKSPQKLMRDSGYVGFADLRAELSDIPRDELDAVLRKLLGDQSVIIVPENAQFGLLERDRDAALNVGNQFKHWLKIMPEGLPISETTNLTAAVEVHTGAMVALVPTDEDAERLAVDGGEDADQLHVTLGYLGEAALIPEEVQHALIESVARCALDRPTIVGNAFALAAINPETGVTASTGWELDEVEDLVAGAGGREPCVALLLSGSQLPGFHEYVMRSVQQTFAAAGVEMHQQHSPWVAHLTLVYTPDADLSYFTDRIGPVTFDRVRLAFGGEVYDIPLGEDEHSADSTMMEPSDREEGDDS